MTTERKKIKRKLDLILREITFIKDGYKCVVCRSTIRHGMAAGHLFNAQKEATRWSLMNLYTQCRSCNRYHQRDFWPLVKKAVERHGWGSIANLHDETTDKSLRPFRIERLRELVEQFTITLNALKQGVEKRKETEYV